MTTRPATHRLAVLAAVRLRNADGATMPEYALVVAFVALVALAGVQAVGVSVEQLFRNGAGALGSP